MYKDDTSIAHNIIYEIEVDDEEYFVIQKNIYERKRKIYKSITEKGRMIFSN